MSPPSASAVGLHLVARPVPVCGLIRFDSRGAARGGSEREREREMGSAHTAVLLARLLLVFLSVRVSLSAGRRGFLPIPHYCISVLVGLGGCSSGPTSTYRKILVESYLVDPASSHMLVSKIKPCMSKFTLFHGETANGSLNQSRFLR